MSGDVTQRFNLSDATSGTKTEPNKPTRERHDLPKAQSRLGTNATPWLINVRATARRNAGPYTINKGGSWVKFPLLATVLTKKEGFMHEQ
jgi:hypothetical protein